MLSKNCEICCMNQIKKLKKLLNFDEDTYQYLSKQTKQYIKECPQTFPTPKVMQGIWHLACDYLQISNPYKEIKQTYNQLLYNQYHFLKDSIDYSLPKALKLAIVGNLIDFAASHQFNEDTLVQYVNQSEQLSMSIDDSNELFDDFKHSNLLLYIGDNCGEIVLDKLFIEIIQYHFPHIKIVYAVRGNTIVNDVTIEDAYSIGMNDICKVITDGNGALGCVLEDTSEAFKQIFHNADIIIAKGQGNYEGLHKELNKNIYFMFMVKCQAVANLSKTKCNEIVCLKQKETTSN